MVTVSTEITDFSISSGFIQNCINANMVHVSIYKLTFLMCSEWYTAIVTEPLSGC